MERIEKRIVVLYRLRKERINELLKEYHLSYEDSDIDECASVVEDKAIIFKKSNVADLQSKLQEACEDAQQVQKYKDEAAGYICEKYNWDDVVKETLSLYRK